MTENINEYGIEILFENENKNKKILMGGMNQNENYDDLCTINKIYEIIIDLFQHESN